MSSLHKSVALFTVFSTTCRLQVRDGESLSAVPVPVSARRAVWTHRHRQRHLYLSRRVHRTRLQHRHRRMSTLWVTHHIIVKQCNFNKKVLLRERKRHTDRGVTSTGGGGGTPAGVPPARVPPTGYPPHQGTPPTTISWKVGTPPPSAGWGTPPISWMGYPPPVVQTWEGRYPPPPRCELTDKLKILPPLVLRPRSVKTQRVFKMCWQFAIEMPHEYAFEIASTFGNHKNTSYEFL